MAAGAALPGSRRVPSWTSGDWNAAFGYGGNLLVNVLILTSLLRFAVGLPDGFVFGRVLPALGVMLALSGAYYGWLARHLAGSSGRADVCALPSGPGVGHIFIVVFAVMVPVKLMTGDPMKGWAAGVAWVFLQSLVVMLGGVIGRWIRKITPRAALLAALAGISLTYISITPISQVFLTPVIGLVCFGIVLLEWFGGVQPFRRLPAGLLILAVGAAIGWGSNLAGLNFGQLTLSGLQASLGEFGLRLPIPSPQGVLAGLDYLPMIVTTAVPFGVYDVIEAVDNVESAAAAGDSYATWAVLVPDGLISMVGALLGNPFMLVVYVGHPGWKAMGGRTGYTTGAGLAILAICLTGVTPLLMAAVPIAAVAPILLFVGLIIGSQAFRETPRAHAPAIVLGILPHLCHWGAELVRNTLGAAGVGEVTPAVIARLGQSNVALQALDLVGGGAVLTGIVLAAIAVYVIDRKLWAAAAFCLVGAGFSYVGLMHSSKLELAASPWMSVGYLALGLTMVAARWLARTKAVAAPGAEPAPIANLP
jgi:AGZA family xanthine/uracil permease-like MFS transporter